MWPVVSSRFQYLYSRFVLRNYLIFQNMIDEFVICWFQVCRFMLPIWEVGHAYESCPPRVCATDPVQVDKVLGSQNTSMLHVEFWFLGIFTYLKSKVRFVLPWFSRTLGYLMKQDSPFSKISHTENLYTPLRNEQCCAMTFEALKWFRKMKLHLR